RCVGGRDNRGVTSAATLASSPPMPSWKDVKAKWPTSPREQAWWIARAVASAGLVAYYTYLMIGRFNNAFHEYSVNGDQIQGAWQYWRYHVKGALPPGQLLTDYAFAYHSPPFHWAWAAALSTIFQPLRTAAITDVITF